MNLCFVNPMSADQQKKIMEQMYLLMPKQVRGYHKKRHMGENTSVPVELARELIESITYTLDQLGEFCTVSNIDEAFRLGQEILDGKYKKAKAALDLVIGTAPGWQTECRWEALASMRHYLERYDHLHLAHREPDDLFYPILIPVPEDARGIDRCAFYLNILWIENQIMASVPDAVLERLWDCLPSTALNPCEYVLINGVGKALLGSGLDALVFTPEERARLIAVMRGVSSEALEAAAQTLCRWLKLENEDTRSYVQAVIPQLAMWTGDQLNCGNMENIFL